MIDVHVRLQAKADKKVFKEIDDALSKLDKFGTAINIIITLDAHAIEDTGHIQYDAAKKYADLCSKVVLSLIYQYCLPMTTLICSLLVLS